MPPPITRHKTRDVNVRMMRAGSGAPMLFLHGAGGLPPWGAFAEKLASKYDLIAPEHPGFGDSDNPSFIRNIQDMAMYYLDFLDALGLPKVHVVGTSLGIFYFVGVVFGVSAGIMLLYDLYRVVSGQASEADMVAVRESEEV